MFSTQPFHKAGTKAGTAGEPMIRTSPGRLTEAFIRSIKEPCKHGDGHGGHGLTIVARDRAGGGLRLFWRQAFTIDGKKRSTGLGGYPLITLKEGRYKAFDNARKDRPRRGHSSTKAGDPNLGPGLRAVHGQPDPRMETERKTESKSNHRPLEHLQNILPAHTLQASLRRQRRGYAQRIPSHLDPKARNSQQRAVSPTPGDELGYRHAVPHHQPRESERYAFPGQTTRS